MSSDLDIKQVAKLAAHARTEAIVEWLRDQSVGDVGLDDGWWSRVADAIEEQFLKDRGRKEPPPT